MKKLACFLISICFIFVCLNGCNVANQWDTSKMDRSTISGLTNPNISMTIKEIDIKPSTEQLTLFITNFTNDQYTYSLDQALEVNVDNIWYVVPLESGIALPAIAMILEPISTREDVFNLAAYYKNLKPGHYRAVKIFNSNQGEIITVALFEIY